MDLNPANCAHTQRAQAQLAVKEGPMPVPSGPNSVLRPDSADDDAPLPAQRGCTGRRTTVSDQLVSVPPMSPTPACTSGSWFWTRGPTVRAPGAP